MSKKKHELIEMPVSYGENYTELVHEGEGIKIDKGVISASGGSGGGAFLVRINITYDTQDNPVYSTDVKYSELLNAINTGNQLIVMMYNGDYLGTVHYPVSSLNNEDALIIDCLTTNGSYTRINEIYILQVYCESTDDDQVTITALEGIVSVTNV